MKIPLLAALLLFSIFAVRTVRAGEITVSPPAGDRTDATPILLAAIERASAESASRLVLSPGTYHLYPERAFEKYLQVSNHESGLRRIGFPLRGVSRFEIDGQGARLVCHGQMVPFLIEDCESLTLRRLSIDFARPFFLQGTVITVDEARQSFDIEVLSESNARLDRGRLVYGQGAKPGPQTWWQSIEVSYWVDPATRTATVRQPAVALWNGRFKRAAEAMQLAQNRFRLAYATNEMPTVGSVLISKGSPSRFSPGILISHSRNVRLEEVSIHHAGGMGLIAQRSENITVRHCQVTPTPGSARLVSTTADATHFVYCKGAIVIEDCLFENMLDDAINVHGIYGIVGDPMGPATVGVFLSHLQQLGFDLAQPGDVLQFSPRDTLLPYGARTVKSVRHINEEYLIIEFTESLTGFVLPDSRVENLSWQPSVTFRRNVVRNNRARSLLISTGGKVLIEENRLERPSMYAVLLEGDSHYWYESGPVSDFTFRKNVVIGHHTSMPLIHIAPRQPDEKRLLPPYHRNLRIEDNVFKVVQPWLLNASRVGGLAFTGNRVEPVAPATAFTASDTFSLNACEDVVITQNTFALPQPASCRVAPAATMVRAEGNTGWLEAQR